MALRYIGCPAPHERPYTMSERSTLLTQERLFHRFQGMSGTIGLCSCGASFADADKKNVRWRFDLHVNEAVRQLEARLDGLEP